MRWDGLFADLEAQAEALEQAERAGEVQARTRGEIGELGVHDRLRAAIDTQVRLRLAGGLGVVGVVRRVGPDWLLLDEGAGREVVVVVAHLLTVRGLGRRSATPGTVGLVESRLGVRHALRGVARDRLPVRLHLAALDPGAAPPGPTTVDATIDRVGADFIEVAAHSPGELRRRGEVRDVELIPLAALVAVRRGR